jgi:hypothetical protein
MEEEKFFTRRFYLFFYFRKLPVIRKVQKVEDHCFMRTETNYRRRINKKDALVGLSSSQDSYCMDHKGAKVRFTARSKVFLSFPQCADRLHDPPILLWNGCQGLFLREVKLTTHLYPVPMLGIRGTLPPLPHTCSWRGA